MNSEKDVDKHTIISIDKPTLIQKAELQWLPWDNIKEIGLYLDLISLCRASVTCRCLYLALRGRREEKKNIPWRISIEYHFSNFKYYIHSIWLRIGWFGDAFSEGTDEMCDYCAEQKWSVSSSEDCYFEQIVDGSDIAVVNNSDVKTVTVTGKGGSTLSRILKYGPIVPIWFKVDIYREIIVPYNIGDRLPAPAASSAPDSNNYYFDETRLLIGSTIQTSDEFNFDRHRLNAENLQLSNRAHNIQYSVINGEMKFFTGISPDHLPIYYFDDCDTDSWEWGWEPSDDWDYLEEQYGYELDPEYYNITSSDEDDSGFPFAERKIESDIKRKVLDYLSGNMDQLKHHPFHKKAKIDLKQVDFLF